MTSLAAGTFLRFRLGGRSTSIDDIAPSASTLQAMNGGWFIFERNELSGEVP